MSMCYWYATFLLNAADSLWGFWLLCCCSFVLFFPFSHCYDCGSINTAWILPGPSYGLWLLLFFPLILSICRTVERSSVAPKRLMLKICQPVMWWVFSSGGKIFTWAQQETVVGATSKWFSGCTHERVVISPEALQELIFQKTHPQAARTHCFLWRSATADM